MITGANATLYVRDLQRALHFYTDVLGCSASMHVPGKWAQVAAPGGLQIGLHPVGPVSPSPLGRGAMSLGFMCDGPLDADVARLTAKGAVFNSPVSRDGPISIAHFTDPDGNPLYLASYS